VTKEQAMAALILEPDAAVDVLPREAELQRRFAAFLRASVTYLVEANFHGYNLVRHDGQLYALSLSLGAVDLSRTASAQLQDFQDRRLCFIAETLEALKKEITRSAFRGAPELIEQNFRGFNLVAFQDKFIALACSLGAVDLGSTEPAVLQGWQDLGRAVMAPSLAAVKEAVVRLDSPPLQTDETLGAEYRHYHITEYQGVSYAIPTRLGRLNLDQPAERNLPEVLSARRRADLRCQIDRALARRPAAAAPALVERDYRGFNLYSFGSLYLASESARPTLDLEAVRRRQHGPFFSSQNLPALKQQLDEAIGGVKLTRPENALLLCPGGDIRPLLDRLGFNRVTLLLTDPRQERLGLPAFLYEPNAPALLDKLRAAKFDCVIVPYGAKLGATAWERFIAQFCRQLLAVYPDGPDRFYRDDHFNRILYNMAYLRSMFSHVPSLAGRRVLEVGCSDGLTCDIVAREKPAAVLGVDMLDTTGLLYPNSLCTFRKLDATRLPFEDRTFDLVYSIATFEHVSDPLAAFHEMKRVLKPGGLGYVQTAPFYYSPFGHHMFGYFDDYPWIHVRLAKAEIIEHAKKSGAAAKIEAARGGRAEEYIEAMINQHHVNGKLLHEYGVEEFGALPDVQILNFNRSHEGQDLLTPQILTECKPVNAEDLVTHGFELVFRVK
jgi:ubiquinone/menaquinone biosynthesis C-methylase UbiE